jgi:hypothetical protein
VVVTSSPPEGAASAPSSLVELTLSADAPIEKVRAAGLRRVSLEGGRAVIVVAPWTGSLAIDAELAGGVIAQGAARASGPRDVTLTAIVAPAVSSSAGAAVALLRGPTVVPLASAAASGSASGSAPASASASAPRVPAELHANPYAR